MVRPVECTQRVSHLCKLSSLREAWVSHRRLRFVVIVCPDIDSWGLPIGAGAVVGGADWAGVLIHCRPCGQVRGRVGLGGGGVVWLVVVCHLRQQGRASGRTVWREAGGGRRAGRSRRKAAAARVGWRVPQRSTAACLARRRQVRLPGRLAGEPHSFLCHHPLCSRRVGCPVLPPLPCPVLPLLPPRPLLHGVARRCCCAPSGAALPRVLPCFSSAVCPLYSWVWAVEVFRRGVGRFRQRKTLDPKPVAPASR